MAKLGSLKSWTEPFFSRGAVKNGTMSVRDAHIFPSFPTTKVCFKIPDVWQAVTAVLESIRGFKIV